MAEPSLPKFAEPGSFVRYYGTSVTDPRDTTKKLRFIQLMEREAPLRYPYSWKAQSLTPVAVDATGASVTFTDLDPAVGHVEQIFMGVAPGLRVRFSLPFDTRLLRWDTTLAQISDDQAAVVTHGLSGYETPEFEFWVPPNKNYPAVVPQNATADLLLFPGGKSIYPRIIFLGANFRVEPIGESQEVYDMLVKKKIPSKPILFGGSIRQVPR